jgi:hypothetical protein
VAALLRRNGYRRLILAGPREARAELKSLLPASALKLLTAEGAVPLHATGNEPAGCAACSSSRPDGAARRPGPTSRPPPFDRVRVGLN